MWESGAETRWTLEEAAGLKKYYGDTGQLSVENVWQKKRSDSASVWNAKVISILPLPPSKVTMPLVRNQSERIKKWKYIVKRTDANEAFMVDS